MYIYRINQQVRIRPEWQDAGDDQIIFIVREDRGERVLIEAQLGLRFNPLQSVDKSMVEPIED